MQLLASSTPVKYRQLGVAGGRTFRSGRFWIVPSTLFRSVDDRAKRSPGLVGNARGGPCGPTSYDRSAPSGPGYNPPMPQYTPDTIEDVHLALRGLSHRIRIEIEPGVPLVANTVAGLRARATWPPGLQLMVPDDPNHPKSVLKVERRK
jgi:hypothetical protein